MSSARWLASMAATGPATVQQAHVYSKHSLSVPHILTDLSLLEHRELMIIPITQVHS